VSTYPNPTPSEGSHPRWYYLIQKYHDRTITLMECYELRRWLMNGPLKDPTADTRKFIAAKMLVDGVEAVIADKTLGHMNRTPSPQEKP